MSLMRELWKVNGTPWMLEQWGVWSRQADSTLLKLWYPNSSNFAVLKSNGTVSQLRVDDDTAMVIQDAINDLGEHNADMQGILLSKYLFRRSVRNIAENKDLNRRDTTDLLHDAESWIDARLFVHFKERAA